MWFDQKQVEPLNEALTVKGYVKSVFLNQNQFLIFALKQNLFLKKT